MRVVLAVDAIAPNLSGVGRYTLELVRRLARSTRVSSLVFYRGGEWTADPARLQMAVETETPPRRSRAPKVCQGLYGQAGAPRRPVPRMQLLPARLCRPRRSLLSMTCPCSSIRNCTPKTAGASSNVVSRDLLNVRRYIITHSCTVRDEVIKFTAFDPARVVAIPLAASGDFTPQTPDRLAPALAEYGLAPGGYGLCVSTIDPRKKLLALVEAWGRLPRSLRERTPLAIVGGQGWLSEEVNAAMSRGTAEGWVRQLGYVSQAALPGLYAGAALFAYPSIYEGFGLPPIEAMACGLPVIRVQPVVPAGSDAGRRHDD